MNHIEATYSMTDARQGYERAAREEFDERVAAASGSFGWENISLLVLFAACLAMTLLTGLHRIGWWPYPFGAAAVLCAGLVVLRWRHARRPRRRVMTDR
ncbi:hypothetical protein LE181_03365 [Streptomyces sp. SCA3-4]|uniref:hypothetical protein n=1 Tax=Streptomyces sichuanensis TaxID=2871810 RepID=UPI001CE2CFC4|nr:hypothetical protein [Streptomyces sichuanensis]MCA6091208.1 hypothetical protein [Streptomyces sichuanensis]